MLTVEGAACSSGPGEGRGKQLVPWRRDCGRARGGAGGECSYLVMLDVLVAVGVVDAVMSLVSYLNMHHHNFSLILSFLNTKECK